VTISNNNNPAEETKTALSLLMQEEQKSQQSLDEFDLKKALSSPESKIPSKLVLPSDKKDNSSHTKID